ncbi:hypothetical protein LTR05_005671 [Lithohypha guttulata]|uniref:Major facilitator superfamily (MFS) profile domain-containing protein n=1 Tax=Lithohypha guttulata TaxID=1690604 RepID=A0AAN7SZN3_9EURO|nr:hypothetical protein LTR05_005671 [Lithohypha guttulata]
MSYRNLYIAATIACMTGALFGYSVGFIGGILVLPSLLHHFSLDALPAKEIASAQSRLVSSWLVGCVIGVPLSVPVATKFGRKVSIIISASLYTTGAVLQFIDVHNSLLVFQLGRLVNGIGVGAGTLVSPLYISEISPANQRGTLMSGYQVAIQVFALIGFWGAFTCNSIFPSTSNLQWQLPVSIQLVPGAILFFGGWSILPESPRWLASKHKIEAAKKALSWLRMTDRGSPELNTDMIRIQRVIDVGKLNTRLEGRSSFLKRVLTRPLRTRMLIGAGIMIFQNLVGLNALNYFSPIIFMSAGFTTVSASLFLTGLFGLVKLITSLLFMFVFVRMKGNRFWLLLGSAIMGIAMFVLAFCIERMAHNHDDTSGLSGYGIVSVLMVYIFAFAFGVSLGPISWNVCSEIFPSHINTRACAVTTCIQWLSQIFIASITPPLIASIGYGTYIFYGVCCVLAFFWCALYVPETRGVALGPEMDRVFGDAAKDEVAVSEIEDIDEVTPLIGAQRRRSSIALVV